jgi:uncharacterized Zn finger protein (UPF0148 family)
MNPLYPELADAKPCPFCRCDFLFFKDGAVACDNCEAEGPFVGHFDSTDDEVSERRKEAIVKWNRRGARR